MNTVRKVLSRSSSKSSRSSSENDMADRRRSDATSATSSGAHGSPPTKTAGLAAATAAGAGATGFGRSVDVRTKDGTHRHSHGHESRAEHLDLSKGDVVQDVKHLAHVTKHTHQRHETEEVTREKEHHRHIHHVQHHVQPIHETEHAAEVSHQKVHPVTHIEEKHASTDKDAALLANVAGTHKDEKMTAPLQRTVVDKGERVTEHIHHHIHNVVQPVLHKDTHEHHRIHTVIPSTITTHEAPIIHESTMHKPIAKSEYLKTGGILGATHRSVADVNLLHTGTCDRKVSGVAEQLEKELGLGGRNSPRPMAV